MNLGWQEILLIVLVVMLFFGGGKKLADLGKGLGEGIRGFKQAMRGDEPDPGKKDSEGPGGGASR